MILQTRKGRAAFDFLGRDPVPQPYHGRSPVRRSGEKDNNVREMEANICLR